MSFDVHPIIMCIISSFVGGGLGATIVRLLMRNEAKEALKPDITRLDKRIDDVENEYVTCRECNANHKSVDSKLESMDKKMDIILETVMKIKTS